MFSETRERIVAECARCAVHDQHAAGAALGWRLLRDEIFGQIVMEIGDGEVVHPRTSSVAVALPVKHSRQAELRPGAKAPRRKRRICGTTKVVP